MQWPDFFVIGAPKAGTTTLDSWLRRIPGIAMASRKEPRYFAGSLDLRVYFQAPVEGEAAYQAMWDGANPAALRGEASPAYLVAPGAPSEIAQVAPEARIIVALRDPVARAFSHFRYRELRTGRSKRSFGEAIRAEVDAPVEDYSRSYLLEPGFYGRHLDRWGSYFESIHVVWFDEIVAEPERVVEKLGSFLGVSVPDDLDLALTDREQNRAASLRWPWLRSLTMSPVIRKAVQAVGMDVAAVKAGERILLSPEVKMSMEPDDRRFLEDLYRDDQDRLRELLGVSPPWHEARS